MVVVVDVVVVVVGNSVVVVGVVVVVVGNSVVVVGVVVVVGKSDVVFNSVVVVVGNSVVGLSVVVVVEFASSCCESSYSASFSCPFLDDSSNVAVVVSDDSNSKSDESF